MSYDLFFRTDGPGPALPAIRAWFASRPHTTVDGTTASYRNDATGVAFAFDLQDDGRLGVAPVSLVLPLLRPSVFVLEAEGEVAALVRAFGLRVLDPQDSGVEASYDPEALLRSWHASNVAAHRSSGRPAERALPTATNVAVWSWNRAREAYDERLGTIDGLPCHAPAVALVSPAGDERTVLTAVAWCDGMPLALPEVDLVLAACEHGRGRDRAPRAIPLVALRPWLDGLPRRGADHRFGLGGMVHATGLPHWLVDTDAPPPGLLEALGSLGTTRRLDRLSPEQVLDRETVDAVREWRRATPGGIPRFQ